MQRTSRQIAAKLLAALSLSTAPAWGVPTSSPRQLLTADYGWKFLLGDPADAAAQSFQDSGWRTVDLPHDWSIEEAPSEKNATGSGGGYFPAGLGTTDRGWQPPVSVNPGSGADPRRAPRGFAENAFSWLSTGAGTDANA